MFAGRVLATTDASWAGSWLTARDADRGLYVLVHRNQATGTILAEVWVPPPVAAHPATQRRRTLMVLNWHEIAR